jgi:hypothetical protein
MTKPIVDDKTWAVLAPLVPVSQGEPDIPDAKDSTIAQS